MRAAVHGANDGIVSTASLIVGVAAAAANQNDVLIAGVAGLVRHSTLASVGQMLARLLVQASLRTEGSRSQNLIRAASMKSLPRPVTPSSGVTPALSSRGLAALLAPIAFRCPNASMTNCRAPASFMSVSQPWADKTIATASNNCDGEPAS